MTDFILVAWVSALIGMARMKWMLGRGQRWKRGEKLRLLFAGYNVAMCALTRCCTRYGTSWARTMWISA
jgi:hypothetical protein